MLVPTYDADAAIAADQSRDRLDADTIKALAEPIAADIARELLGDPNRKLSTKRVMAWGRKGSLKLELSGPRAFRWHDFEMDEGGDLAALVMKATGLGFPPALDWLAARLGGVSLRPDELERRLEASRQRAELAEIQEREQQARRIECAIETWAGSHAPAGSPVQAYLTGRGCWHDFLSDASAVRYHPNCRFQGEDGPAFSPAMIALMTDAATGEITGIHRTHILTDGSGKGEFGKQMLGRKRGAIIRLRRWQDGDQLAIGEGIENSLTGARLGTFGGVAAALDAGNLGNLPLLPGVAGTTIFADPDMPGVMAAASYGARHQIAQRPVWVVFPPKQFADLNDAILNKEKPATAATVTGSNANQNEVRL
jgi:putative DNA primase/helicase